MKLSLAAFLGQAALAQYVPGQNPVNCGSSYFRPGAEWPLQSRLGGAQSGKTVRLCQNNYGKSHYYATLFNTDTNIPVYSAVKIRRNKYASTYPRPTSNWHYMCNGLCGTSTPSSSSSFYGNLASVGSANYDKCDRYQPQDNDYLGNNAAIGIDRGHLIPNALMNQNEDAAKATFTLTNVAPQYSTFNQQAWNQLECMVRKFMEEEINNEDVWILVGTYGKDRTMNGSDNSKNNVDIPEFYWHAFCYTDGSNNTYSWVYMQKNASNQSQSSGDNFMSVSTFSNTYYGRAAIFDNACQNPSQGYGDWNKVINDWSGYRSRWNC